MKTEAIPWQEDFQKIMRAPVRMPRDRVSRSRVSQAADCKPQNSCRSSSGLLTQISVLLELQSPRHHACMSKCNTKPQQTHTSALDTIAKLL